MEVFLDQSVPRTTDGRRAAVRRNRVGVPADK